MRFSLLRNAISSFNVTNFLRLATRQKILFQVVQSHGMKRKRPKMTSTNYKNYRCWEYLCPPPPLQRNGQDHPTQYTIMSYNILSQDLLMEHLQLYINVDPQLLRWSYRLSRLRDEILYLRPDILCLQEMQFDHLQDLVTAIRDGRKLEYIFKKRTGHRTDGCAIIYDRAKFRLLKDECVEYFTPGNPTLNRDNVALLGKFETCEKPAQELVVATTHLLFNPKRDDVRRAQLLKLFQALDEFSKADAATRVPIFVTGDFNFTRSSSNYELLLCPYNQDKKDAEDGCESQTKALQLSNVYPEGVSTHQNLWINVDFLLHSVGLATQLKVWSVYRLPQEEACLSIGPIPNTYVGSDHYSLAAKFSIV